MKGRLGLDEVLALVELSARAEEKRKEDVKKAAESELNGEVGEHPPVEAEAERETGAEADEGEEGEGDLPPSTNGGHAEPVKGKAGLQAKSRKEKKRAAKAAKAAKKALAAQ
jgi:hypothetical protein